MCNLILSQGKTRSEGTYWNRVRHVRASLSLIHSCPELRRKNELSAHMHWDRSSPKLLKTELEWIAFDEAGLLAGALHEHWLIFYLRGTRVFSTGSKKCANFASGFSHHHLSGGRTRPARFCARRRF